MLKLELDVSTLKKIKNCIIILLGSIFLINNNLTSLAKLQSLKNIHSRIINK